MPAAKAPKIGDKPITPANAALPKHVAVATTSTVPLTFQRSATPTIRGITLKDNAKRRSQNIIVRNRSQIMSNSWGATPEVTIDKTIARTTKPNTSSITAAFIITFPSTVWSFPISSKVLRVIAILVAVRVAATKRLTFQENPRNCRIYNPKKKGTITPNIPTTVDLVPTILNCPKLISRPAIKRRRIAPISANINTYSFNSTIGSPKIRKLPKA